MEKGRKRKGISLSHHSNRQSLNIQQPLPLQRTSFTQIQFPRFQLTRSTVAQKSSTQRESSAPKPKINFSYPIDYTNSHVQFESRQKLVPIAQYSIPGCFNQRSSCVPIQKSIKTQLGNIFSNPTTFIPERYQSFQQCKETIAKKLFGQYKSNSKDVNSSQRSNRFKRHQITEFTTNIQLMTQNIHQLISQNLNIQNQLTIAVKPPPRPLQTSNKINRPSLPIISQKIEISNMQLIEQRNQLANNQQIGKEKLKERKRNPMKLQEMEKRLKQIIKICDQNL